MRQINPVVPMTLAVLLLGAQSAVAQDEQVTDPPAEDEQVTEASATFGGSMNSGNTDSQRYNAALDYLRRGNAHRFTFEAEANRGESEGVEDVNNSRAATGYDWFFSGPWYTNSSLSWTQDKLSDLYSRYTAGAGAGYQFFDDERVRLSVEFGPSYIYEESLQARDTEDEAAARWALDYRQYLLEGAVRIFHDHEVIVSLDDSDNWYATTRTGLRMPVRENLSASLQFNYDYNNQPPPKAEYKYDSATLITLTYDWF